jgi:hypothetical protein
MMFYNGFNLLIDVILVSGAAIYFRYLGRRDFEYDIETEINYQYNEGWETAISDKERNTVFRSVK